MTALPTYLYVTAARDIQRAPNLPIRFNSMNKFCIDKVSKLN